MRDDQNNTQLWMNRWNFQAQNLNADTLDVEMITHNETFPNPHPTSVAFMLAAISHSAATLGQSPDLVAHHTRRDQA